MSLPIPVSARDTEQSARLSRIFAQSLVAADLAEPLLSFDDSQPARAAAELCRRRGLQVLGVRCEGVVTGWVASNVPESGILGGRAHSFAAEQSLDASASLAAVLTAFAGAECVFVRFLGEVAGVITRRDLQKAPLRMWLFGAITLMDLNLSWAIGQLYPDESWREKITPGRLEKALALHAERQRRGDSCSLLECLQLKDKADILVRDHTGMAALGISSRREADRLTRDVELLRNQLAHAQELKPEHLATAARLAGMIDAILRGEGVQRILTAHNAAPARD
jgi:hypothetical protein